MPIYEYVCDHGHRFEVIHGIHDAGPAECPVCRSTNVRKAFAAPAIHFKGSGWAKKDRSTSSKPAAATPEPTSSETAPTTSDTASGDGTSAARPVTKEPATKAKTASKGDPD